MKNNKGFTQILIIVILALLVIGGGIFIYQNKNTSNTDAIIPDNNLVGNDKDEHGCIGSAGYTWCAVKNKCLRVWEEKCEATTSDWKTYTNTNQGYSFQYPKKLSLSISDDTVTLSHSIPFENHDGGCDLKGDSELSKTLTDFNLSINIVSGKVNQSYVDGSYSGGMLNGKWSYMGAEGCGQTNYYFPITGDRTLIVSKHEIQMLSPVVTPDIREKILAVPGVISYEEAKVILDQILSTFKFSVSVVAENMVVKVYFAPKNSEQLECNDVVAVERTVPKTTKVGTVALEELLKGPTAEEKVKGYFTSIPVGSKLNSLEIVNGEARADFNDVTESGGGSCSMGVRGAQIRQTLLQFPTVKTVVLSINGRTQDIFQP